MTEFLPVTLKMADGTIRCVASLADAEAALKMQWRNPGAYSYREAVRLLAAAKTGECRPAIAFSAFTAAARQQGLLQPTRPSHALGMLDKMAQSIKVY